MKRLFVIVAGLALCLLAVLGCHKEPQPSEPTVVHVQNVSLDISTAELTVGGSQTIKVTITPSDAADKGVTFESSDNKVVTVDSNGKITAVGPGTATVTVRTKDGNKTATVTVTVKAAEPSTVPVTGVKLDQNSLELQVDGSAVLTASVEPEDATNKEVSWKSSAESVATVDANGKVTAIAPGTASITVTTADGGKTDDCAVTVTGKPVAATGIEFIYSDDLITFPDDQVLARVRVLPADAANKKYTWSASDPSIFTVSKIEETEEFDIIYIKGLKVGEAKLTVTTEDGGFTASVNVQVREFVEITSLSLSPSLLDMVIDETAELTAVIKPDNATAKFVTWSTDNPDVASVQSAGVLKAKVTANGEGIATLTATSVDGKKTAACVVTVSDPSSGPVAVTGITLNETSLELTAGDHIQLVATVHPSDATEQGVSWLSSDDGCCSVDEQGYVTAIKEGVATIYAQSDDNPNIKAACQINVAPPPVSVTGVEFTNGTNFRVTEGKTARLLVKVLPEDAENKNFTIDIADPSILEVDQIENNNGIYLRGLKAGKTNVTVTTEDGGHKATTEVTVEEFITLTSLSFDKDNVTVKAGEYTDLTIIKEPANATSPGYMLFRSEDSNIVVVGSIGANTLRLWAQKPGTATVTFTYEGCDLPPATCVVTVLDDKVSVTGIEFTNGTNFSVPEGKTARLLVKVLPEDAENKNFTINIADPSILEVDHIENNNGIYLRGLKAGKTNVTVTTEDGGHTATTEVTVTEFITLTSLSFDKDNVTVKAGEYTDLTIIKEPANATSPGYMLFRSEDSNIVVVGSIGANTLRLWAQKPGTATVTFTYEGCDLPPATCVVTVTEKTIAVTGIEIQDSQNVHNMTVGSPMFLRVRVSPEDATNHNFTAVSSDPTVLTINRIEKKDDYYAVYLDGLKGGNATVTVTTEDGGHTASTEVKVVDFIEITSMTVSPSTLNMEVGDLATLTAIIEPENATARFVTWTSSNGAVAGIQSIGFLTANIVASGPGTATITATSVDNSKSVTCEVTVVEKP